jgi:prepilin-type N-terminal cleavage/methylation domain-containing protein/prepilin-type processing-associated H-X9-DG protein
MVTRNSPRRLKKAFTLIELMVVVAIIALLISILLPSLAKAREQAYQVKCAAHLSGIFKGFFYYADDRSGGNGFIPNVSTWYTNIGYWPNQIEPYIDLRRSAVGSRDGFFHCPADEDPPLYKITGPNYGSLASVADKITADSGSGSGSSNPFATGGGTGVFQELIEPVSYVGSCDLTRPNGRYAQFPPKLTEIKRPYCFPVLTEASGSVTMCFRIPAFEVSGDKDMLRHYGGTSTITNGVNFMFADGHVQWHAKEFVATQLICCIDVGGQAGMVGGAGSAVGGLIDLQNRNCGK